MAMSKCSSGCGGAHWRRVHGGPGGCFRRLQSWGEVQRRLAIGWRCRAMKREGVAIVGVGHPRGESQAAPVCVNAGLAALSVTCQRNNGNYSQNYFVIFLFAPFRLAFKSTSPLHGRCTHGRHNVPLVFISDPNVLLSYTLSDP